ncbi:GNAT family N-acetyltransferase [uncultured Alistipes sp.]|uniref:GNAT family N-acetyltransferase n=1 Tax=uncultured Alistipes sp. TaxID=538949 RepID=UPI0025DC37B9|nr:GNAT family N-acetyltransferase [uncultured Alistipes sp.]
MEVVSIRENPALADTAIRYISGCWPEVSPVIYEDCIRHAIGAPEPLPQWYLLMADGEAAGCVGLVTNDFISRMDLWPWACALYVEERLRGHALGRRLIDRAAEDARAAGFGKLYLSTDHIGLYEKWDFRYIGQGYHPWGGESRIYERTLR